MLLYSHPDAPGALLDLRRHCLVVVCYVLNGGVVQLHVWHHPQREGSSQDMEFAEG